MSPRTLTGGDEGMKKQEHTDTERLGLEGLGSQAENLQYPGSSGCSLYTVEQIDRVIPYSFTKRCGSIALQKKKEAG